MPPLKRLAKVNSLKKMKMLMIDEHDKENDVNVNEITRRPGKIRVQHKGKHSNLNLIFYEHRIVCLGDFAFRSIVIVFNTNSAQKVNWT